MGPKKKILISIIILIILLFIFYIITKAITKHTGYSITAKIIDLFKLIKVLI